MKTSVTLFLVVFCFVSASCETKKTGSTTEKINMNSLTIDPENTDTATFGNGCFWCTEAIFQQLKGVKAVMSGYSGGNIKNPAYREVCSGRTGHAEVLQIYYDPNEISFKELLEVFWQTHDPTTLNRQGNDIGTQYRSAIFYHSEDQRQLAEKYKAELDKSGAFANSIVTEITAFSAFYPAEEEHRNYYLNNPDAGYCRAIIQPKIDKFRKVFKDKIDPAK